MNLYLISQDFNNDYDAYDSAVVAAKSPKDARTIHPSEYVTHVNNGKWMGTYGGGDRIGVEYDNDDGHDWVSYSGIEHINVEYLGITTRERGVVLASFNAG